MAYYPFRRVRETPTIKGPRQIDHKRGLLLGGTPSPSLTGSLVRTPSSWLTGGNMTRLDVTCGQTKRSLKKGRWKLDGTLLFHKRKLSDRITLPTGLKVRGWLFTVTSATRFLPATHWSNLRPQVRRRHSSLQHTTQVSVLKCADVTGRRFPSLTCKGDVQQRKLFKVHSL